MRFAVTLALVLLFVSSAHATSAGLMMLRDAAILHDDQRIRSLIDQEVRAGKRGDFQALNRAISALSKATDPLPRYSTSH
jgi:hypothetical protein